MPDPTDRRDVSALEARRERSELDLGRVTPMSRRRFIGRSLVLGTAAVAGPSLLSACGGGGGEAQGDLLAQLREQGSIKVGFANEAPYAFRNQDGRLTGEAPEVAREVLSRLGIDELEPVLTEFGSLISGLRARRFDIIAAGMFITPERCEDILFSDPDYCAPQAFAVKEGNPLGLTDYEAVADTSEARLGLLGGAVEIGYAEAAGVSEEQINILPDTQSMIAALESDRIDAFGLTSISVRRALEAADNPNLAMTDTFVPVVDGEGQLGCGGYGFRPDNEAFRDEFNRILNEMKENDEILPIVEEFGFTEDEIDAAKGVTAEEKCAES